MANIQAPYGLQAVRALGASPYTGALNCYYIPSTDGSQYQPGALVGIAGGSDPTGFFPAVAKAAVSGYYRGVIAGVLLAAPGNPSLVGTNLNYTNQIIPAVKAQGYYVLVDDDPDLIFRIQDDGLTALTASAIGQNANVTVANPSGASMVSGTVLTTASVASTSTLTLKIISLEPAPGNVFGAYANWLVRINMHDLNGAAPGL